MAGMGWILSIILGAIAGWIAEKIMKSDHGLLTNIILGILGAVLGNAILRMIMGTTTYSVLGQLVVAVIGACILIWGYRAIRGRT
ncbi:GlsB/YeaQ/YmgE family stress response membrane protein [Paracoccus liaowanqingii]|uniref:GlsB/YeaQ/YmgE family stress response membrane protein n=1 Tax=Paracoccus liaowanqingii TaxID=2560053 RepID=A0A4V1BIQ1_9RHOB|nr:GlsB/YeaQ/YmgE family stress response membrane protein [Paracoccus liaowanqingii]QBX33572.1 GlsB/YeaQ/YmgE family stress response membrane protein [Paracoccus liaowanqingii]TGN58155.1 GlsB/YeaQ/YmgE family stress response membrane protein [Paracoccus liaowanqingii]